MSKNAVIYVRQSKEKDESTSIEDQERLCRVMCEREGWNVVDVVVDRDTSGSEIPWRKRKNFPRVFDIDADVLVLYRWSRLSREEFDQTEILKKWGALDRTMQAAAEPVDTTTASGVLHRSMILLFAAHEAREKSERWREALGRRIENGLPKNGLPRFGYAKDGKAFVPDPVTGPVLRDLYLRYTAGAGAQQLRNDLNEAAVTTTRGNAWTVSSVMHALDSGFGAGLLIENGGTFAQGAHAPVISAQEWTDYLRVRTGRKQAPPRRRTARWFLAGLAICGDCGGRMHGKAKQALCGNYHNSGSCTGVWIKRTTLEQRVAIWLGGHIEDLPERTVEISAAQTLVDDLARDLEGVQGALTRLATGWATGVLDDDGYRGAQADLLDQRRQIENDLRDARDEAARVAPVSDDVYARLESPEDLTPNEWNTLLGRVLRRVEVYKDRLVMVPVIGEASIIPRR